MTKLVQNRAVAPTLRTKASLVAVASIVPSTQLPPLHVRASTRRKRASPKAVARGGDVRVAVPSPSANPVGLPTPPLSWTFTASLLGIAVAALTVARHAFSPHPSPTPSTQGPRPRFLGEDDADSDQDSNAHSRSSNKRESSTPLSSVEERTVASFGPMLLAAETSGQVDESATLSDADLESLDFNLRMLVTSMDAQLNELLDQLVVSLPSEATRALETISMELDSVEEQCAASAECGSVDQIRLEERASELRWQLFSSIVPHADDASKRTYRSLLHNREVQAQLLRQVERQAALRARMSDVQRQLEKLQVAESATRSTVPFEDVSVSTESAAGLPKPITATLTPSTLGVAIADAAIPHPRKAETGGEDAFFFVESKRAFGVADGVGGWANLGVDPSLYSRLLMTEAEAAVLAEQTGEIDPMVVLKTAFVRAHAPGSCTVAIATVEDGGEGGAGRLRIASLGDCCTCVVRQGSVIFATDVQEHKFNQPFQLASPQHHICNSPEEAQRYCTSVLPGDVIVMGSDGLFDNLWQHELENVVAQETVGGGANSEKNVDDALNGGNCSAKTVFDGLQSRERSGEAARGLASALARRLAEGASRNSRDASYASPFSAERHERTVPALLRTTVPKVPGGKLDDVTVLVAVLY